MFRFFLESFFEFSWGFLFGKFFLETWFLKICDFAWEVFRSAASPRSLPRAKHDRPIFEYLLGVLSLDAPETMTSGKILTTNWVGAWGGVEEELKTFSRGVGKCLWKEMFVLFPNELRINTPRGAASS
jgi:hypothetical protein